MAARNEAKIKFIAETSEFNEQIKKSNQSLNELRSELKLSDAQFKDNEKSVEALSEKKRILQEQLEASAQKVEALRQKLDKAKEIYGENSTEVSKLKTQLNNAERQYVELEGAVEDTNKELKDADPKTKAAKEALDDLADAADKSSDGFTVMKGAISNLVSDGIGLLIDGVKEASKYVLQTGMDFEAAMSQVEATSGASSEEMVQLTDKAKQMGATTKFSASESAEAFNYMAMAGWKTGDMLDGIAGIMNLAASANADLGTASDIVTDALTAMGYAAKDSGRLADVMAAASSNANTNVELMGYTFKYAAPLVGALGYSMEDLAITTGLMANAGIKGEQAGTTMRAALTNLISPAKTASDTMKALGFYTEETIDVFDQQKIDQQMLSVEKATLKVDKAQTALNTAIAKYGEDSDQATQKAAALGIAKEELRIASEKLTVLQEGEIKTIYGVNEAVQNQDGSMKSLRDTLVFLRKRFADMTEAEQASAASAIFGKEAMSGMLAVINASDEDFEKLTLAIDESEGSAQKMAETMQDNLKGDVEELGGALETVGITAYEKFSEPMRGAVQSVTEALGSADVAGLVGDISTGIGELAQQVASKVPGVIKSVVNGISWLVENIDNIITGVKAMIATWAILKGLGIAIAIGGLVAKIAAVVAGLATGTIAIGGVTAALGGMSAALGAATGGISLIVGALAFLISKFMNSKSEADLATEAIKRNASAVTAFSDTVANTAPSITSATDLLTEHGYTIAEIDGYYATGEAKITEVIAAAMKEQRALRDDEIQKLEEYKNKIAQIEKEKLDAYRQAETVELIKIKQLGNQMSQEQAAQSIANMKAAQAEADAAAEQYYNSEIARITKFHEAQGTLESQAYQDELAAATSHYQEELRLNQESTTEALGIVMESSRKWVTVESDKWNAVLESVDNGEKEYAKALQQVDLDNANAFLSMYQTAVEQGANISAETKETALAIVWAFSELPDDLEESGKAALLGMISGLEDEIPGLKNASEMSTQAILNELNEGLGLAGTHSYVTKEYGREVSRGLKVGMAAEQGTVEGASEKLADVTTGTLADELGVHSPSRVTKVIGGYVAEGLAVGMESKKGTLGTRIASFASGLISKMRTVFGVASPSKLTAEIGGYLSEGLGVGIKDNEDAAVKPMQGLANKIAGIDVAGEWNKLSGVGGSLNYDVSAQLGDYVSSAIDSNSPYALLGSLIDAVEDLANRAIVFDIDGTRFATATAGASDTVSGNRLNLRNRGLAL